VAMVDGRMGMAVIVVSPVLGWINTTSIWATVAAIRRITGPVKLHHMKGHYPTLIREVMNAMQILLLFLFSFSIFADEIRPEIPLNCHSMITDKTLTLDWSVPSKEFKVGDLIIATLIITNTGEKPIILTVASDEYMAQTSVARRGKQVLPTVFGAYMSSHPFTRSNITFIPGSTKRLLIPLSRCFDISLSGVYQASSEITYDVDGNGVFTKIVASPITLELLNVDYTKIIDATNAK
jgi:hypothetical protein